MTTTIVSPVVLHAALRRGGVWLVDAKHSMPTDFYHKCCLPKPNTRIPVGQRAQNYINLDKLHDPKVL